MGSTSSRKVDAEQLCFDILPHVNGKDIWPKLPVYTRIHEKRFQHNVRVRDTVKALASAQLELAAINEETMQAVNDDFGNGDDSHDDAVSAGHGDDLNDDLKRDAVVANNANEDDDKACDGGSGGGIDSSRCTVQSHVGPLTSMRESKYGQFSFCAPLAPKPIAGIDAHLAMAVDPLYAADFWVELPSRKEDEQQEPQ